MATAARIAADEALTLALSIKEEHLKAPGTDLASLSISTARVDLARAQLAAAASAEASALVALADAKQRAADEERQTELARLTATLADPQRAADMRAHGRMLVDLAENMQHIIEAQREDVARDNALVDRIRALGGCAEYSTGMELAQGVAEGLITRDRDLSRFASANAIRWLLALPHGQGQHPASVFQTATDLGKLVWEAFSRTGNPAGRAALEREYLEPVDVAPVVQPPPRPSGNLNLGTPSIRILDGAIPSMLGNDKPAMVGRV